jgi:hypothetical protein
MSPKELATHRWSNKGRLTSIRNNLLSMVEGINYITDCERLQLCRVIRDLNIVLDRFPQRTADLILKVNGRPTP